MKKLALIAFAALTLGPALAGQAFAFDRSAPSFGDTSRVIQDRASDYNPYDNEQYRNDRNSTISQYDDNIRDNCPRGNICF